MLFRSLQAHPQAAATCPVADAQSKLLAADRILQQGRPLAEALVQVEALHPETRHLLAVGEQAGTLEDALQRALTRRQAVASVGAAQLSRWIGGACYVFGCLVAVYVIFRVYGSYGAMLRGVLK